MPAKGDAKRGFSLSFGSYGLKALETVWMTDRQIESARQAMTRHMVYIVHSLATW